MSETGIIQQEQGMSLQVPAQAAVNVWQDRAAFEQVSRVAAMLAKSTIVPQNYQGKPEDCFIAVEMASRMNTSPIFIMQNLYVVKGKPSWAGQACMAMIMSCGKFRNVRHVYTGTKGTDSRGCYVRAERISNGEVIEGTEVTIALAKAEGWMANSKWKNMPEQMLGYRAASFFARMYCPEAMMGLQTTEEIYDSQVPPSAMTPSAESLSSAILAEEETPQKQTAKKQAGKTGKTAGTAENAAGAISAAEEKNAEKPAEKAEAAPAETVPAEGNVSPVYVCEDCGAEIAEYGKHPPEELVKISREKYGRALCTACGKKAKAKAEQEAYQKAIAAETARKPQDDLAAELMAEAGK